MMRLFFLAVAMICCIGFLGCDFPEQKRPISAPGGLDIDTGGSAAQSPSEPAVTETSNAETKPAAPEARKTAEVGDGKKGQYKQKFGRMSIFDTTIGTMYRTRENLTYNVQIPHAMNLYQASNDGKFPRTHEEFMKEIIQANNIKLPELREGRRYIYNPEKAVLEVEYPINE